MEIVRPELLPVTLISISRNRERRSFRASLRAGMCTSCGNSTRDDGSARRQVPHPCGFQDAVLFRAKPNGGWHILNRLRRLRVAYPLRSCFVQRVGNSLQGWRTLLFSGCGFSRISSSRNQLWVRHVFFRFGTCRLQELVEAEGFAAEGAAVGGPLGVAGIHGEGGADGGEFGIEIVHVVKGHGFADHGELG